MKHLQITDYQQGTHGIETIGGLRAEAQNRLQKKWTRFEIEKNQKWGDYSRCRKNYAFFSQISLLGIDFMLTDSNYLIIDCLQNFY